MLHLSTVMFLMRRVLSKTYNLSHMISCAHLINDVCAQKKKATTFITLGSQLMSQTWKKKKGFKKSITEIIRHKILAK